MSGNHRHPSGTPKSTVLRTALALARYNRATGLGKRVAELTRGRQAQTGHVLADFGRTLVYYAPIHAALERNLGNRWIGKTGLHLAAGTGIYTRYLQDLGVEAVGLDNSPGAQQIALQMGNRHWVRHDADLDHPKKRGKANFPFPANTFDFFVSDRFLFSHFTPIEHRAKRPEHFVFHRAKRPEHSVFGSSFQILKKLGATMKPGGIGVLTVFKATAIRHSHLRAAGFKLVEVRPAVPRIPRIRTGLADQMDIMVIQKIGD